MASIEDLKNDVCRAIDRRRETIEEIGDSIGKSPELGFKEFKTARVVSDLMNELSIPHQTELAITGVKGVLEGGKPGPTVALVGELDSLLVGDHPMADPETGAAHACGHNAQIAGLMGAMLGLAESGIADQLTGSIVFFAVPAEEYVEVEHRIGLVREGKLGFLGGKSELIRLGHFDDIDMAMMIHTHSIPNFKKVIVGKSSNGCVVKLVGFEGRASHAGNSPHMGINALNAANIAMAAINAQRETFRDQDTVRIHPIFTKGGELVNVVPAEVRMESFVRGKSSRAILDADMKINRSLRAGALAVGGKVRIDTLPGYFPLKNDSGLERIFTANSHSLFGEDEFFSGGHGTGSTDMGDISCLMPALHPMVGGATGTSHGADFKIVDKDLAYLAPAKLLAMSAIDLLYGNAETAKTVQEEYQPMMSKTEYLNYQNKVFQTEIYDGVTGTSEIESDCGPSI
ncbi:MAG: amidohydrolase [Proteobacteria bacterium]|nr:amidohydrolase [Pseudomonadota bacterium]